MEKGLQKNVPQNQVSVTAGSVTLAGNLDIPQGAKGIVLFAHGSGSSRFSPRNQFVAQMLQKAGLATLLLDLLTPQEEAIDRQTKRLRFDIDRLAARLIGATHWLQESLSTRNLNIGYFGASTGSAAALVAASFCQDAVSAIVSRGGRIDLAGEALSRVKAPTLLIVGGDDTPVLQLNQKALVQLQMKKQLAVITGATHLFEEPGALEQVAQLASRWFNHYFTPVDPRSSSRQGTNPQRFVKHSPS